MGRGNISMFTLNGKRFRQAGRLFDLSSGCIDLEKGYNNSNYMTVIPMSPGWDGAKIDIVEEVSEKQITFILTDDLGKAHILTVDIEESTVILLTEQLLKILKSALPVTIRAKYLPFIPKYKHIKVGA